MVTIRSIVAALGLSLVVAVASAQASSLQAHVAHDVVREGEQINLVLRANGGGSMSAPDLSPLEKDFEILGTSQSQQISVVNGRYEATLDWIVTLEPRRTGSLTVPAIRAGNAESQPIEIRVTDAGPPPSRADAPDLFIESSVDEKSPFVQGEVRYTVKVYDGVGLLEGGLTEPQAENAKITPMGEGRTYEEVVNGRPYRVHEREFAVSPQASGEMTISPVVLEARVNDPQARARSPFDQGFMDDFFDDQFFGGDPFGAMRQGFGAGMIDRMMNRGREVRVRSNPIKLSVQARPDGVQGEWFLPARGVELKEAFEPAQPTFRVGDAVKRTIELRALGAASEQLPRFEIPAPKGMEQYDEGSQHASVPTDAGTVSVLQQSVALVPTQPGSVTLPAVEVSWWDVEAKTTRTASLPEKTIDVLPAVGDVASKPAPAPVAKAAPAPAPQPEPKAAAEKSEPVASEAPAPSTTVQGLSTWTLGGIVGAAFALGLGGAWVFLSKRRGASSTIGGGSSSSSAPRPRDIAAELKSACQSNDARATRDALVGWARATWGVTAPASCAAIARKLGHEGFIAAVAGLERSLYAPDGGSFRGDDLWREFRAATRRGESEASREAPPVLPGLYPTAS